MQSTDSLVLIIGGTSGIGLAAAQRLASSGLQVVIVGRDPHKLARALEVIGPSARGAIADASHRDALDNLLQRLGTISHLVLAAAGGGGAGRLHEIQTQALRNGFEGKFWVHWNAVQSALRRLQPGGSITFITAVASRHANPGTAGFAAINGAIQSMVPTLARELAPTRVNAVSPGVIDTSWWRDRPQMFEALSAKAPLGRAGKPDEVADAIVFLIRNAFVTGVILDVDGGLHLT